MAYVAWWQGSPHGVAFNIGAAVGQGHPNRPDDVMLIQWLLRHLLYLTQDDDGEIGRLTRFSLPDATPPAMTGSFDPETARWLAGYQQWRAVNRPASAMPAALRAGLTSANVVVWPWQFPAQGSFPGNVVEPAAVMALMNYDLCHENRAALFSDMPRQLAAQLSFQ